MSEEAPERIWLQLEPEEIAYYEQTWCADKINESDTEYVLADEIERLRESIAKHFDDLAPQGLLLTTQQVAEEIRAPFLHTNDGSAPELPPQESVET